MNKTLLISLSLMAFLNACTEKSNQQNHNANKSAPEKSTKVEKIIAAHQPAEQKLSDIKIDGSAEKVAKIQKLALADKRSHQQKYFTLHSEKFELLATEAVKGAKVFNLSINEYGTIKGSVVVISENKQVFKSELFSQMNIAEIAKDTYRLIPNSKLNLLDLYRTLIDMAAFNVVEMEIDYSPIQQEK